MMRKRALLLDSRTHEIDFGIGSFVIVIGNTSQRAVDGNRTCND